MRQGCGVLTAQKTTVAVCDDFAMVREQMLPEESRLKILVMRQECGVLTA